LKKEKNFRLGVFYCLAFVVCGVFIVFASEYITEQINIFVLQFYWLLGGLIPLLFWIPHKKHFKKKSKQVMRLALLLGIGSVFFGLLYFTGIHILGASAFAFVRKSKLFFVMGLSVVLLKEKISPIFYGAILLTMLGILGLSYKQDMNFVLFGVIVTLLMDFWYSLHDVLVKKYIEGKDDVVLVFWRTVIMTCMSFMICLLFAREELFQVKFNDIILLFITGFVAAVVQKLLSIKALRNIDAHKYALIINLNIVLILLLAPIFSFQRNILSWQQIGWGSLIVLGVLLVIGKRLMKRVNVKYFTNAQ